MTTTDYGIGWADGKAGRDPDSERMALGADRCNAYERGYLDSGYFDAPREPVDAAPTPDGEPS